MSSKISALTALTGVTSDAAADLVPVVDTSATQTKKMTFAEFFQAMNATGWKSYNGTPSGTTEYAHARWVANVFTLTLITNGGAARFMNIGAEGDTGVSIFVNAATRWGWSNSSDAYVFYPTTTNAQDIGAPSFLVRDQYSRQYKVDATITPALTTGDRTINKAAGTVNIAAAGTTVTVTNSLVTANSLVFAVIRTNDGTATIKNVVPAAGSFVINLTAAATAEVSIGFYVVNPT